MGNDRHFSFKKAQIENFLKAEFKKKFKNIGKISLRKRQKFIGEVTRKIAKRFGKDVLVLIDFSKKSCSNWSKLRYFLHNTIQSKNILCLSQMLHQSCKISLICSMIVWISCRITIFIFIITNIQSVNI
mgnify:CR=1 FL=1